MIDTVSTTYTVDGVEVTLTVKVFDEGLPYSLAEMFRRVIDDTSANPHMIIEELQNTYGSDD